MHGYPEEKFKAVVWQTLPHPSSEARFFPAKRISCEFLQKLQVEVVKTKLSCKTSPQKLQLRLVKRSFVRTVFAVRFLWYEISLV